MKNPLSDTKNNIIMYCRSDAQVIGAIDFYKNLINEDNKNTVFLITHSKNVPYDENIIVSTSILKLFFYLIKSPFYTLVLGDLRSLSFSLKLLTIFSRRLVLVDDGLVTIWLSEKLKNSRFLLKKVHIHTKYYDFIKYDKSLISQQVFTQFFGNRIKNSLFIIGGPYVENGYLSDKEYLSIINQTIKKVKAKHVFYFAHRLEIKKPYLSHINIMNNELSIEKSIANLKKIPTHYFAFFSSALIDCYISENLPSSSFLYSRLPRWDERGDLNLMGFSVEKKIYNFFDQCGFKEL
jgi:hypothetical protein